MPVSRSRVQAYVLSPHRLAAEFLVQILAKNKLIDSALCDRLPESSDKSRVVFVLDACFFLLPMVECIRILQSRFPESKFVIVDGSQSRERMLRLMRLGVHGFVEHCDVARGLNEVVQNVAAGHFCIPHEVLQTYLELSIPSKRGASSRVSAMTSRELQVLERVEQRFSNKEIANLLNIGENTVKYHVSNILGKLHAVSRGDIVPPSRPLVVWNQFLQ